MAVTDFPAGFKRCSFGLLSDWRMVDGARLG